MAKTLSLSHAHKQTNLLELTPMLCYAIKSASTCTCFEMSTKKYNIDINRKYQVHCVLNAPQNTVSRISGGKMARISLNYFPFALQPYVLCENNQPTPKQTKKWTGPVRWFVVKTSHAGVSFCAFESLFVRGFFFINLIWLRADQIVQLYKNQQSYKGRD